MEVENQKQLKAETIIFQLVFIDNNGNHKYK